MALVCTEHGLDTSLDILPWYKYPPDILAFTLSIKTIKQWRKSKLRQINVVMIMMPCDLYHQDNKIIETRIKAYHTWANQFMMMAFIHCQCRPMQAIESRASTSTKV